MKKLMIVAAVAMMAVASQAASAVWATGRVYWSGVGNALSATKTGGTNNARLDAESKAYFFDGLTLAQYEAFTTAASIWDAFDATTGKLTVKDTVGNDVVKSASASGAFSSGTFKDQTFAPNIDPGTYDYSVVVVTHSTGGTIDAYSANAVAPGVPDLNVVGADRVALNWGLQAAGDATIWQSAGAVPEPTSGILLLLGVAGLALRRRRA